jgi:chemosensory pili system protein ChpB (putative protein-glutamate methylesterase)
MAALACRGPRIGLVTDSDLNRHILQRVLTEEGYELTASLDSARLSTYFKDNQRSTAGVDVEFDAWLIDMHGSAIEQALDLLIENSELPLLVNDEIPAVQHHEAYLIWQRRLLEKLEVVAIRSDVAPLPVAGNQPGLQQFPEKIWVLAASLGGPEAVRCFLSALSPGLPLAMVYGQHIETNFDGLLVDAVGKQLSYPLQLVKGEYRLIAGEVAVVPVEHQLRFLPRGRIVETRKKWPGCYQPALDQVIAGLARIYRERLGVIVFSGTCNDGAIGCRVAKACGGTIWVQSPDSCLSPSMPHAALATGCVSYQGTPEQLAQHLSRTTVLEA